MNKNCTFLEFSEYWLKQQKELKSMKESSYSNFSLITKKHLQPMFGHKQINKLKPEDLQNAVSYWLEKGNLKSGKGLSIKTVKDYVMVCELHPPRFAKQIMRMVLLASSTLPDLVL